MGNGRVFGNLEVERCNIDMATLAKPIGKGTLWQQLPTMVEACFGLVGETAYCSPPNIHKTFLHHREEGLLLVCRDVLGSTRRLGGELLPAARPAGRGIVRQGRKGNRG